jgi:UDP-hydrolysing UDP-N-acetyl-D-glucosamine 2-epimerase
VRRVAVVTVARSDYGIYRPLLRAIEDAPDLELALIVGGMHLSPEFGSTIGEITADGFPIAERVEMIVSSDSPGGMSRSMGLGAIGFAGAYERVRPDILVLLGDRSEMCVAALAATPFLIPTGHISGGSVTEGAIDDSFRHAITKLSHYHFVESEEAGRRVEQLGEAPERVFVVGALGLDSVLHLPRWSIEELNARFGLSLDGPPLLVTFHPVTREYEHTRAYTVALLEALAKVNDPMVFTYPNADTNGRIIIELIEAFAREHANATVVPSLGSQGYISMMAASRAIVGNSSSGIIEAAAFELPVVNIGNRQRGRTAPVNVIHCGHSADEITGAVRRATSAEFRDSLKGMDNLYGRGTAAAAITAQLRTCDVGPGATAKAFYDVRSAAPSNHDGDRSRLHTERAISA